MKVRSTWQTVFLKSKLFNLDTTLRKIDRSWPIFTHKTQKPSHPTKSTSSPPPTHCSPQPLESAFQNIDDQLEISLESDQAVNEVSVESKSSQSTPATTVPSGDLTAATIATDDNLIPAKAESFTSPTSSKAFSRHVVF